MYKKDLTLNEFKNWIDSYKNNSEFDLLNYISIKSERISVSCKSYGFEEKVFLFTKFGLVRWQNRKGFVDGINHIVQLLWEDLSGNFVKRI